MEQGGREGVTPIGAIELKNVSWKLLDRGSESSSVRAMSSHWKRTVRLSLNNPFSVRATGAQSIYVEGGWQVGKVVDIKRYKVVFTDLQTNE